MSSNRDWKKQLGQLLERHNTVHAGSRQHRQVSYRTMAARAEGLFRSFVMLRALGYQLAPYGLGGRHIAHLVLHWCGLPPPEGAPPPPGAPAPKRRSAAYLQQQLSFLRVFAGWIGKAGMVHPARYYLPKEHHALVRRNVTASYDHSLAGQGIDAAAVVQKVAALDPWVGVQLQLMWAFGLRRKEAVMFCPHLAEVPAGALPANAEADTKYLSFLAVRRGTKGGRLRYTAVRNPMQREALAAACALAGRPGAHVGKPGLSLKQSLERFSYIVRKAGLTRAQLGATSHGLRHQFAHDLYFELTGAYAPVRGGETDPATMAAAYLEVAHQVGHGRLQISGAYLGARRPAAGMGGQP